MLFHVPSSVYRIKQEAPNPLAQTFIKLKHNFIGAISNTWVEQAYCLNVHNDQFKKIQKKQQQKKSHEQNVITECVCLLNRLTK